LSQSGKRKGGRTLRRWVRARRWKRRNNNGKGLRKSRDETGGETDVGVVKKKKKLRKKNEIAESHKKDFSRLPNSGRLEEPDQRKNIRSQKKMRMCRNPE